MLKLSNIRFSEKQTIPALRVAAAGILGVPETAINDLSILKLSVDARKKPDVRFVYTLTVDVANERSFLDIADVSEYFAPEPYAFPSPVGIPNTPPVIVGMGPAGLFAALCLCEAGIKCIVLERGQPVDQRAADVAKLWRDGVLDRESNVQFGEGGAGTFSDGKLSTGISDRRVRFVLDRLVEFGAPEEILYLSKPHVGTDKLRGVVKAMRERLLTLGCDIRFGHKLTDIDISSGALRGVTVEGDADTYSLSTDKLILAVGNGARDTFEMLHNRGVSLAAKNFSVGVRIEHLQSKIDLAQYGRAGDLPASDYKLVAHMPDGKSVYTFCVCPGGTVVASSSEPGGVVTNGMSEFARDGENCNSALLVPVTPDDFGIGPLDGVAFQQKLERAAFTTGGGDFYAPAQLVGDFLEKRASTGPRSIVPTYLPGVTFCNLWDVLPEFVCSALVQALLEFSRRVAAFSDPDAVMTAVETRSSSPVRILREDFEAIGIRGIFPCGEGAGYAGGIMSAAVDGIRCAEALMTNGVCHQNRG